MAEDRKKVWNKVEEWYHVEAALTEHDRQKYGERVAKGRLSLDDIVEMQRYFQRCCRPITPERVGMFEHVPALPKTLDKTNTPLWREMMRTNVLATVAEMMELLETCPWKPWKQNSPAMTEGQIWEARLEIIDALCFLMNCWLLLGGDGQELAHLYAAKMKENHARQKGGY